MTFVTYTLFDGLVPIRRGVQVPEETPPGALGLFGRLIEWRGNFYALGEGGGLGTYPHQENAAVRVPYPPSPIYVSHDAGRPVDGCT